MDKEQEIRLQFLEEAQEYLGTIETVFLNVANLKEPEQLNAMLRAAHSIKGGAAMMGYAALSQLAHRFEDFCKVIKVRYTSSLMDTDLESLLLNAVDGMNQVVALYRKGQEPDGAWLGRGVGLVFDRIHERLGDPQAEDDAALLMEETGQDMVALLFESGVDGGLQRLESILATPGQPCLLEESLILAQELGGLGEMLQLQGFVALCADIAHQLQRTPDQAETIARQALHSWRECQSLVLAGQLHCLPDRLVLPESPPDLTVFSLGDTWTGPSALTSPTDDLEEMILQLTGHSLPETEDSFDLRDLLHEDEFGLDPLDLLADDDDDLDTLIDHLDTLTIPNPQLSLRETPEPLPPNPQSPAPTPQPPPPDFLPPRKTAASSESQDFRESTVRVAVRQLDQLNDLFGELTIERNGLSLHLGRLQQLMGALAQRVRTLEQANTRLRTEYDRITVQSERSTPQVMANGARFIQPLIPSPSITEKGSAPTVPSLIYQFDALELDRYSDLNLLSQEVMETIVQVQEVTSDLQLTLEDAGRANHHLNRTAKEMQVRLTQARMRPLSDILNRFPRALREMAVQYGKRVELKIYGGNTLVDRKVLEALSDPLMHLLRNCFDHGIESPDVRKAAQKPEQGTIEIRAAHRGNQTIVILRDDGRGINVEKIKASALRKGFDSAQLETATEQELLNLIFEPGFSTVEQVTELSGRGVGMDVVRANLKRVRGDIRIDTQPGQGTAFTLSVPLTLSVIRVLLVESGGMLLAFPKDAIEEVLLPTVHQLVIEEGQPWLQLEDERLPLLNLRQWLAFQGLFRAVEM
ncbi:MAG: chemotaxis protein CheA [Leptolyngbyaceae cyanobacterium bins.59]|nr:chemotaxis protein CheA [Leptolyngbyaceae cyanobacterium bins.59]